MLPQMKKESRYDVVVVGAGLVGGALACALARHGVRTAVIDRLDPRVMVAPAFDGRASAVALTSRHFLDAIGVWPHIAPDAQSLDEIRISDNASLFFLHYDHADIGNEPLGYMAENRHLRLALAKEMAALRELTVISGVGVTGMTQTPDEIILQTTGETVRASLAVSAEGRESQLRKLAGIKVAGWAYAQMGLVATIAHEHSHHGIAHERFLPAGPFAILPLKGNRASLVWTEREDTAASYLAMDDGAFLREIEERVGGFLGRLTLEGPRFSYPLGLQFAERYTQGRLVLAGDAAHGIHPIAGQGVNLGWRDAAALTEIIVDSMRLGLDVANVDALSRYERWRRADNLLMAGMTDTLNRLFSNDVAPVRLARDLGLAAVNKMAPLKKVFMRHAMGAVGDVPRLMRGSTH